LGGQGKQGATDSPHSGAVHINPADAHGAYLGRKRKVVKNLSGYKAFVHTGQRFEKALQDFSQLRLIGGRKVAEMSSVMLVHPLAQVFNDRVSLR